MFALSGNFYKDPIHQEINFDNEFAWLFELTTTPEFHRLASINQLGLSYELFPGATATRFIHSLGTYEITRRILSSTNLWNTNRIKSSIVLAAALLHDIGHGPASHCFEEYMTDIDCHQQFFHHEFFSQKLILNPNGNVNKILQQNHVDPRQVADLLFASSNVVREAMWMQQLVSSELDADRIDYLLRDSYCTGANYGVIDPQLLIKWALFNESQQKIFYNRKAIPLLENFLISRYHMYENVYLNFKSITLVWQLRVVFSILRELLLNGELKLNDRIFNGTIYKILVDHDLDRVNLDDYILLNDHYFYSFINSLVDVQDKFLNQFVTAYVKGINLFKIIWFETEKERDAAYKRYYEKYQKKFSKQIKFLLAKINLKNTDIYMPKNDTQRIWVERKANNDLCDLLDLSPLIDAIVSKISKRKTNFYLIYSDYFFN